MVALCAVMAVSLLLLAGCAPKGHQVIESQDQCMSCHSDERPIYDVADKAEAIASGGSVVVKTPAGTVYLCKPLFTNEQATHYVPLEVRQFDVEDGTVDITIDEPGVWAICYDTGDASVGELVRVEAGSSETPEITLN